MVSDCYCHESISLWCFRTYYREAIGPVIVTLLCRLRDDIPIPNLGKIHSPFIVVFVCTSIANSGNARDEERDLIIQLLGCGVSFVL